jgi:hypothetical protein
VIRDLDDQLPGAWEQRDGLNWRRVRSHARDYPPPTDAWLCLTGTDGARAWHVCAGGELRGGWAGPTIERIGHGRDARNVRLLLGGVATLAPAAQVRTHSSPAPLAVWAGQCWRAVLAEWPVASSATHRLERTHAHRTRRQVALRFTILCPPAHVLTLVPGRLNDQSGGEKAEGHSPDPSIYFTRRRSEQRAAMESAGVRSELSAARSASLATCPVNPFG